VALRRLAALRAYKRVEALDGAADEAVARAAGLEPHEMDAMFRQIAIGDYDERYVIPKAHPELGYDPNALQGSCGLDFAGGPGPPPGVPSRHGNGDGDIDLRDMITHVESRDR
jgi:nitrate reductase beta subunit